MLHAAGVVDTDGSVREQIFQAVQRDVIDAAHPEGTATLSFNTSAGTLECLVGAGVVTPMASPSPRRECRCSGPPSGCCATEASAQPVPARGCDPHG